MSQSDPPPHSLDPDLPRRTRLRSRYRRVLRWSMGVSVALHLLALALYPRLLPRIPAGILLPGGSAPAEPIQGTEVVNLIELPAEEEAEITPPEEPEEEEEPQETSPQEPLEGRGTETGEEAEPATPTSAAEALRPRAGDLRLWTPVEEDLTELSREEYMRLRLLAELEAMNDSTAVAEELARRARDWTYTDEEGRKWGVSPGKVHLGDITLPLPFSFSAPPSVRQGMGDPIWEWDEIQRGAGAAAVRETWKERAEAIRKRKEAERKADTTGIRGGNTPGYESGN